MKYIKEIQSFPFTSEPQKGDYVIINSNFPQGEIVEFEKSHIGRIIKIDELPPNNLYLREYIVEYDKIPNHLQDYFSGNKCYTTIDLIEHFSPNKEDLEIYINAEKYNL